jgi:hypothetical protein
VVFGQREDLFEHGEVHRRGSPRELAFSETRATRGGAGSLPATVSSVAAD